jgi:hypothetical protein
MYEHRHQPLAARPVFIKRIARSAALGTVLILISLLVGMTGYRLIEGLSWIDSYQEAAMILSGMGPTATMQTAFGKFFGGSYALYSGLMLILIVGVIIAPIVHRFFHKLHIDLRD